MSAASVHTKIKTSEKVDLSFLITLLFLCLGMTKLAFSQALPQGSSISLLKQWQFVPGRFVDSDTKAAWDEAFIKKLPSSWTDVAPGVQVGSFRTEYIPSKKEAHALVLGDISSAGRIFVNGENVGTFGYPTLEKASTRPGRGRIVMSLAPADRYEIIIHVAAFYSYQGGIWAVPIIGPQDAIVRKVSHSETLEACFFGGILAIGLYHLFLFLIRREPISGAFGLCCLAVALRMGFSNSRVVEGWLGGPWHFNYFMEYASLYAIAPSIEFFFATIFFKDYPRKIWPLRVIPYALSFLTLCFDVSTMSRFLMFVHVHHVVVMVIVIYTLYRAIRNNRLGSRWIVLGSFFMILFSLIDIAQTFLGFAGAFVIQFGFSIFIMSQAAAIAQVYNEIYRRLLVEEAKQVQINEELQRLDRLKDDFLANTSHELRTPLHAMIGLGEAILQNQQTDTMTRDRLHMIVSSARRLALLVNDILDFSKLHHETLQLQKKSIDLQALTHVVCELLRPMVGQKPVQFLWRTEGECQKILADPNRLQQILLNLVGNALKFTHEGKVQVILRQAKPWIEIEVHDTGIGIPAEQLPFIFDTFTQGNGSIAREFGGTGLGLAVTKKLVDLHQGSLDVESRVGQGTSFRVRLPLELAQDEEDAIVFQAVEARDQGSRQPAVSPRVHKGANQVHLLLVDDDSINLEVLKAQLQPEGYVLTCVGDAFAALKLLGERNTFDIALIDVMMPRMSGYELTRRIRESKNHSQLPIILLTAKSQSEDICHGFDAGANDYLIKPFARIELLARLQTIATMKHQSQSLTDAILRLREEESAKVLMVKDLAHRSNNPLYASQLCLNMHEQGLQEAKQFIINLFGTPSELDPEHRAIVDQIEKDFARLDSDVEAMSPLLEKVAQAISEIRLLSGVDGRSTCEFDLSAVLQEVAQRLKESLGPEGSSAIALRLSAAGPFIAEGHPMVFMISLERLVRQMVEDSKDPLDCFLNLENHPQPQFCIEFRSAINGEIQLLSAKSQELLAHVRHMLEPYGMTLMVRQDEAGIEFRPYPYSA